MDLWSIGNITFDWTFLTALFNIVVINVILSGDNAVCIALAVRSLPPEQRKKGILLGAGAAIVLRVVLTFFVAHLLEVHFLKLVGGVLICWIAVKLFLEGAPEAADSKHATSITQALKIILIADITMSLDNMLAVGAASHGNLFLLLFGLGSSIPFVIFTSNLLSQLMEKYPAVIYLGAAILGKVGGEMIITDPFVANLIANSIGYREMFQYAVEGLFATGVILIGKLWMQSMMNRQKNRPSLP